MDYNIFMKRSPIVYLLFFTSGVSALIYQIIWTRMLTLTFGHTVYSVSVVLCAFMAGLGLGAFYFGAWVDALCRPRGPVGVVPARANGNQDPASPPDSPAPLLVYGWIEILIALTGAGLSLLFANFDLIYSWVHLILPDSTAANNLAKAVLAIVFMIVPTTLMGATLPIISKYAVTNSAKLGAQIGLLYGLNTLGAAVGALATGFFLISVFGVLQTVLFAAFLNLVIGIGAIRIYQEERGDDAPKIQWPAFKRPELVWNKDNNLWIGISFLCGFTALAYEILWTRLLVFSISSTVYSFSMMLAVFLLGIVLGSLVAAPLLTRSIDLRKWLAFLQLGVGLYVIISIYNMELILSAPWNSYNLEQPFKAFRQYFADSTFLMLLPTAMIGMSFPILIRIISPDKEQVGRGTGWIYAFNTLGAITGSLAAGFFLLPRLGVQQSLTAIAALNLLAATLLFRTGPYLTLPVRKGLTVVFAGLILFVNVMIPENLLQSFFMRDSAGKRNVKQLLYFKEGLTDTVAVFKDNYGILDPDAKRLITNGISMSASNLIATRYMKLFAYVPILLSPNPDDVLVVCFGTGQTTGAAAIHPLTRAVDAVDLSPEVIHSGAVFAKENHNVLGNPKVRFIIEDGRNHLLSTDKRYDVITAEPPPPRTAGTVNLYTKEYYEAAKNRLKPGGIVAQWIPMHSQGEKEVDMHFKTFHEVFPHSLAWMSVANEILIIGSDQPITLDFETLKRRIENHEETRALLEQIEIANVYDFLSNLWYLEDKIEELGQRAPVITDNRPYIEFYLDLGRVVDLSAQEKYVFNRSSFDDISERIQNLSAEDRKIFEKYYHRMDLYQRGVMYANRSQLMEAAAIGDNPALLRYHLQADEKQIQQLVELTREEPDQIFNYLNLGHAYFQMGAYDKSMAALKSALAIDPDQPHANLYMGFNLAEAGRREESRSYFKHAAKKDPQNFSVVMQETALADLLDKLDETPDNVGLLISAAQFFNMKKDYYNALKYSLKALELDPNNVKVLQSIVFSYRSLGIANEVIMYGERFEMLDSEDIHLQFILGEIYAKLMRCDQAVPRLKKVLKADDTYPQAQRLYDDCIDSVQAPETPFSLS